MSEKAREFYNGCSPLSVYEYTDENENKLYAYDGCLGEDEGLTFEELEKMFEELAGQMEEEEIMYYVVNNFGTVEFSGTYNECKEYTHESCYTGLMIVNEAELDRFADN